MEQVPSWQACISLASQEISSILWNQAVHHRLRKGFPPVAILKLICPFQAPHPLRAFLLLSSNLLLGLPRCHLPLCFPSKPTVQFSSSPYVPHVLPNSLFFIWSPNNISCSWWGIPIMNCSLCSPLQCLEWFYLSLLLYNTYFLRMKNDIWIVACFLSTSDDVTENI